MTQTATALEGTEDSNDMIEVATCGTSVELNICDNEGTIADLLLTPAEARKLAMYLLVRADEVDG